MAPKKKQLAPETSTAAALRPRSSRITKPKATSGDDDDVKRSSRITEKAPVEPLKRYKNGLLNLRRTPSHLVQVSKSNALSPLLRIPPELRNKIWELAMAVPLIKAPGSRFEDKATRKFGCAIPRPKNMKWGSYVNPPAVDVYPRNSAASTVLTFQLPAVCRQIYSETATLGSKLNTFVIDSSINDETQNWANGLLPAYRKAITHVEPDPQYLYRLIFGFNMKSLRSRGFPGLTTIVVSSSAVDYLINVERQKPGFYTTEDFRELIVNELREDQGQNLRVKFMRFSKVSA